MRGFTAMNQVNYTAVNVSTLEKIASEGTAEITKLTLISKWIIKKESDLVKILAEGEIKSKVTVEADKASAEAIKKIEKAGWSVKLK